ncbi:hypothetical protein HDV00_000240, partial [Rhizophlyctis rosea]
MVDQEDRIKVLEERVRALEQLREVVQEEFLRVDEGQIIDEDEEHPVRVDRGWNCFKRNDEKYGEDLTERTE